MHVRLRHPFKHLPSKTEISIYVDDIKELREQRNELIRLMGNGHDLKKEIASLDETIAVADKVLRFLLERKLPKGQRSVRD